MPSAMSSETPPAGAQYAPINSAPIKNVPVRLETFVSPPMTKDTPIQTEATVQSAAEAGAALLE